MDERNNFQPNLGNILSPVQIFLGGLVAGILVLCTIGFFVLLPIVLKGGSTLGYGNTNDVGADTGAAPGAAADSGTQPTGAITLSTVDDKTDHIRGAKNAKVTLVEYSDFECPYCGAFHPTVQQLLTNYKNDLRVVYRHFPLSFHPQAMPAAEASECAAEQGKFWEFHDGLFENQSRLGADFYKELAGNLKLNMTKFNDCVATKKYSAKVQSQMTSGNAAGVRGTPHSILVGTDGKMVPLSGAQPYAAVEAALKQFLN